MAKRSDPAPFLTLGWAAIDWIETFCVHGPGDIEGTLVEVDDEFAAFIAKCYQLRPDGRRAKRRAVISRPKGRAKSELAGFLVIFEALGPARFDHWAEAGEVSSWGYEYEAGEPVGRPVKHPEIRCFATELGQAGNTYDVVKYVLGDGDEPGEARVPAIREHYGRCDVGLTRVSLPNGGEITPESAKDTSKDGGKDTFDVFDETHLWVLPMLHRLHQTVNRNLLKRKLAEGWSLETTTMFAPGEGSVAEGTFAYAAAVSEGRAKDDVLLFDHREASAKWRVTNRRDRLAGLREVYGPAASWMPIEDIAANFDDPQVSEASWVRYWFNRPISIQGSWLTQTAWDATKLERKIPELVDVVLSLDGSFNGDATALIAVEVGDVPHVMVEGLWERPEGSSDWQVPILDVEDAIRAACLKWNVVEIVCDPYRWARSMQVLEADRLPVVEFPQSASRMTPATQRATDLILNADMTHDDDLRLSRHVSNAVLKVDSRGQRLYKEHKTSARKIDLAVAMVMGLERAGWHANAGRPAEPSLYVI
jgi:hypothetical protein